MTIENGTTQGATPAGTDAANQSKSNPPPPPEPSKLAEELKAAQERIAALNEENKKHRLGKKEVEELAAKQKKAIELLTGKTDEADPVALEKKATENKIRRAYLKSAFVSEAAKQMHDPDFTFDALERQFADVAVNIETGEVDRDALKTKLGELKKGRSFLFVSQTTQNTTTPPPPGNPDGSGQAAGGSPYQTWLTLKADPLRRGEANAFYEKNRAAILAAMK